MRYRQVSRECFWDHFYILGPVLKVNVQNGNFFGVAIISDIYLFFFFFFLGGGGCMPDIPDIFWGNQ